MYELENKKFVDNISLGVKAIYHLYCEEIKESQNCFESIILKDQKDRDICERFKVLIKRIIKDNIHLNMIAEKLKDYESVLRYCDSSAAPESDPEIFNLNV